MKRKSYRERYFEDNQPVRQMANNRKGYRIVYRYVGLWVARLRFTTETGAECARILGRYLGRNDDVPAAYTRGLYFREVE